MKSLTGMNALAERCAKRANALGFGFRCAITGAMNAVHSNRESRTYCQQAAQKAAMQEYGWGKEDFIREFYKNYL